MNKAKRKRIMEISTELGQVREQLSSTDTVDIESASAAVADLHDQVDEVKSEEEEVRDNYPENLQSSEIYDTMCAAVDSMEYAMDSLDSAVDSLEGGDVDSAISDLENAMNSLEEI